MERHLLEWLTRYGAWTLFVAQFAGIFGLPVPDELLLTIAGSLVKKGQLLPVSTVSAAIGGCSAGITLSYWLGRTVGMVTIRRVMHVPDEALCRAERWFERFGGWLLMFGYFIPGVRHVTALAAGSSCLPFRSFAMFAYPGAVLWSLVFLIIGYSAGGEWTAAVSVTRRWLPAVAVAACVGVVTAILVARHRALHR